MPWTPATRGMICSIDTQGSKGRDAVAFDRSYTGCQLHTIERTLKWLNQQKHQKSAR